jgi:hypothetical protein
VHQPLALVRFLDEVVQHLRGCLEIGDHAVAHGFDRSDRIGRAPEHLLRLGPDGLHRPGVLPQRDDRGLVYHDASLSFEDEGVGCAEIDRQIRRENAEKRRGSHKLSGAFECSIGAWEI